MSQYKVIGLDLAKKKFHFVAMDFENKIVLKKAMSRKDFFMNVSTIFPTGQIFAMEACGGAHYTAQKLEELEHKVILLKAKDVKPYAKARQKNDVNDSIAICKAACDSELMPVKYKTKEQQEVAYLHKARQNTIQQRIQRSNSLITSLFEFGFLVECGKTQFAKDCKEFVKDAFDEGFITNTIFDQMEIDCEEIKNLIDREKKLDKLIVAKNKKSDKAILLETIPGIGPINASILSNKSTEPYSTPKDFAASLGLVPKQNTTGGKIVLGRITKQGDRYARTMLIQAGRSLLMRSFKDNVPAEPIFGFIARLKEKEKGFNVITVAVANKLARIAYACMTQNVVYEA